MSENLRNALLDAKNCLLSYSDMRHANRVMSAVDRLNAALAAPAGALIALEEIAAASLPDQPAATGVDERVWALQHIARLRGIAAAALRSETVSDECDGAGMTTPKQESPAEMSEPVGAAVVLHPALPPDLPQRQEGNALGNCRRNDGNMVMTLCAALLRARAAMEPT